MSPKEVPKKKKKKLFWSQFALLAQFSCEQGGERWRGSHAGLYEGKPEAGDSLHAAEEGAEGATGPRGGSPCDGGCQDGGHGGPEEGLLGTCVPGVVQAGGAPPR